MSFAKQVADTLLATVKRQQNLLAWRVEKKASSIFAGGTLNAHGDYTGTANPYTLFTVTGDVAVLAVVGIVNTDLTGGSATVEVGVPSNTAKLIAQTTGTTLDDGDVWTDAGSEVGIDILPAGGFFVINDGADIKETAGTANVTAGQIDYYCIWAPLEDGALVEAA